jgi:hypothetical protein
VIRLIFTVKSIAKLFFGARVTLNQRKLVALPTIKVIKTMQRLKCVTSVCTSGRQTIASAVRHHSNRTNALAVQARSQTIPCLSNNLRSVGIVSVAASKPLNNARTEAEVRQFLASQQFEAQQIERLLPHLIGPQSLPSLSGLDTNSRLQIIEQSIDFWKQHLKPISISKLKINLNKDYISDHPIAKDDESERKGKRDHKSQKILVDHNYVFTYVEPNLLFIDPIAMGKRIRQLKGIGFISGNPDLWRVFVVAPRGNAIETSSSRI